MMILLSWLCWGACQAGVCLDPYFHSKRISPRFSGELPGGGSREQKDIFQDILLDLQRQVGATAAVIELAQRRLQRNPNHFQALAALAWAYGQSGDTAQQQYIYQDIVRRAGLMPISDQAPALVEARAALQTM
jgi:hypothetical protein